MSNEQRDELVKAVALDVLWGERVATGATGYFRVDANAAYELADRLIDAGYRKVKTITEYGIVFNRRALFLTPPAHTLEEFKERYEQEEGWMITDRDTYLTRTYQRCEPSHSEATVLHEGDAK